MRGHHNHLRQHPQPLPGHVLLWRKVLRKQGFLTLTVAVVSQDWAVGRTCAEASG